MKTPKQRYVNPKRLYQGGLTLGKIHQLESIYNQNQ